MTNKQKPKFTLGEVYYTDKGIKIKLISETKDNQYVVSRQVLVENYSYNQNYYEEEIDSDIFLYDGVLFIEKPRPKERREVEELNKEITLAKKELCNLENDIFQKRSQLKDVDKIFSKFNDLKNIGLLLSEDNYYVVIIGWQGIPEYYAKDDEFLYKEERRKLISLCSEGSEPIKFKISEYGDGSGFLQDCLIFKTEQEAKDFCHPIIEKLINSKKITPSCLDSIKEISKKCNFRIPIEMLKEKKEIDKKRCLGRIEELKKQMQSYQAELDALEEPRE